MIIEMLAAFSLGIGVGYIMNAALYLAPKYDTIDSIDDWEPWDFDMSGRKY